MVAHTLNPSTESQNLVDLCFECQPGLQREFQASQVYIVGPYVNTQNKIYKRWESETFFTYKNPSNSF